MKGEYVKVFDDYMVATSGAPAFDSTGLDYAQLLAGADPLCLQAEAELHTTKTVTGARLNVVMEHSANGRDWESKYPFALLSMPTIGALPIAWNVPGTYSLVGGEPLPTLPSHALVRLTFAFDGGSQTHEARIILHAVVRKRVRKHRMPAAAGSVPATMRSRLTGRAASQLDALRAQGPHPETVAEVRRLASESDQQGHSMSERLDHMKFHLSARARRELVAFAVASTRMSRTTYAEIREATHRDLIGRALRGES